MEKLFIFFVDLTFLIFVGTFLCVLYNTMNEFFLKCILFFYKKENDMKLFGRRFIIMILCVLLHFMSTYQIETYI